MVISNNSKEYKLCYYKSTTDAEKFEKYLRETFENTKKYTLSMHVHSKGLLFSTERNSLSGLIKNRIEGAFSQRKDYSLLSINFYSPTFFSRFHSALGIILLLISSFNLFNFNSSIIKTINIIFFISLIPIILMEYLFYIIEKRKFVDLLINYIDIPVKIGMKEYHSLLGDEEL